jgi:hypothetical protein
MSKPISYSGMNLYSECAYKYRLQNIDKIKPLLQPSYFAFGSAVDLGLNAILLETGSPIEACDKEFKRMIMEPTEFFPLDYDGELIDDLTKSKLLIKCQEHGYSGEDLDGLVRALFDRGYTNLSENQKSALTLCCMASLRAKALLMFEAYRVKVLPLIKSVESVQETLKWKDFDGNEFIAVLDALITLNDGTRLVADNKTSARPYEQDAVRTSAQLAIYSKQTGRKQAAFFVMEKVIRKNRIKTCSSCGNVGKGRHQTCDATISSPYIAGVATSNTRCGGEWSETIQPEVNIQILIDEVSEAEQTMTQDAMSGVANAVKAGVFPKNLKGCVQKYGQRKSVCPYYDFCRSGSMVGLEVKQPSEKKLD